MIKRFTKTLTLVLIATSVTTLMPTGNYQERAIAAVKEDTKSNIESIRNKVYLSNSAPTDEDICSSITAMLVGKYTPYEVIVGSPTYIPLKISDATAKSVAKTTCSDPKNVEKIKAILKANPDLVKAMLIENPNTVVYILVSKGMSQAQAKEAIAQNGINAVVGQFSDNDIALVVDGMTKEQITSGAEKIIKSYDGKLVPVYGYKVLDGTTVKDQGYFVGGEIGLAVMNVSGKPLVVSGNELNDVVKDKIMTAIKKNLGAIIQQTGIDKVIDKVTDKVEDLSDAIDDLSDSIKDKADDIDEAWDKVFDRFNNEEGWGKRDGYTYYYDEDGIALKGVQKINGKTYYFNRIDGAMETGWQIVDGKRCYFDKKKGYQVFLQWVQDGDDWYFISDQGPVKKSEWVNDNGKYYYLKSDGKMAKNWLKIDDNWYYFNESNGAKETSNWKYSSDKWYYLNEDGKAANDWTYINNNWYYFRENSCAMETGWFRADGSWYYADSTGAMKTGWVYGSDGWYYLDDTTGKMKKNDWVYSDGSWYYFNINGNMVTKPRYIDGVKYNFNSDGRML